MCVNGFTRTQYGGTDTFGEGDESPSKGRGTDYFGNRAHHRRPFMRHRASVPNQSVKDETRGCRKTRLGDYSVNTEVTLMNESINRENDPTLKEFPSSTQKK